MRTERARRGQTTSIRAIIVSVVVLILMATAYFVATAGLVERLDMIPIHWSGDLAV